MGHYRGRELFIAHAQASKGLFFIAFILATYLFSLQQHHGVNGEEKHEHVESDVCAKCW